jgi:hypothetical protein
MAKRHGMGEKMNKGSRYSLGFIVFVVFLILKLCHLIDWSWWWVTSPLWISWVLVGVVFGFSAIGMWGASSILEFLTARKAIKRNTAYSEQNLKEKGKYDSL